jgi:hypothetical protein
VERGDLQDPHPFPACRDDPAGTIWAGHGADKL